jgi:hypothetical protein
VAFAVPRANGGSRTALDSDGRPSGRCPHCRVSTWPDAGAVHRQSRWGNAGGGEGIFAPPARSTVRNSYALRIARPVLGARGVRPVVHEGDVASRAPSDASRRPNGGRTMRLLDSERRARERAVKLLPDEMKSEVAREMPYRETVSPMLLLLGLLGIDGSGATGSQEHRDTEAPDQNPGAPSARHCPVEGRRAPHARHAASCRLSSSTICTYASIRRRCRRGCDRLARVMLEYPQMSPETETRRCLAQVLSPQRRFQRPGGRSEPPRGMQSSC